MQKYYITSKFVVHKIECEILSSGDPSALNMLFSKPGEIKAKATIFASANNQNHVDEMMNSNVVMCECAETTVESSKPQTAVEVQTDELITSDEIND